jgi:hypothetical protein
MILGTLSSSEFLIQNPIYSQVIYAVQHQNEPGNAQYP